MRERRRFVRIPEHLQISYTIVPETKTEGFLTKNISQGGISFFVHEFIPENSLLRIRLTLKKISFSFEAFVEIRWNRREAGGRRYEVGVEFVNIPEEAVGHLIAYIESVIEGGKDGC